jgi:hypothetical protein
MISNYDPVQISNYTKLVKVVPHVDPGKTEFLENTSRRTSIKDALLQKSNHREKQRRSSHVLVRVIPASNISIYKNESDYNDSSYDINNKLQTNQIIKRTILTPIINDYCK